MRLLIIAFALLLSGCALAEKPCVKTYREWVPEEYDVHEAPAWKHDSVTMYAIVPAHWEYYCDWRYLSAKGRLGKPGIVYAPPSKAESRKDDR